MLSVFTSIKLSADEKGLALTPNDFWKIARANGGYAHLAGDDSEIQRAIDGLFSGSISSSPRPYSLSSAPAIKRKTLEISPEQIERWKANASEFIASKGGGVEQIDLLEASPIKTSQGKGFVTACETLFHPDEGVAVVTDLWEKNIVRTPPEWRKFYASGRSIHTKQGGWWRINPILTTGGTGKNEACCDRDVTAYRYFLLENDKLPIETQLGILAYLFLPIVSIVDSAGKSLHALVRLDAPNKDTFKEKAEALTYDLHERFGFDVANKNPSRMSRLPDGWRDIKRREGSDGNQRILFLAEMNREAKAIL
jgi:hypothetical protein